MLSYTDIIKKSYRTTLSYRLLWVFGLFVIGSFNLNFLNYQNVPIRQWYGGQDWRKLFLFFTHHPGSLALVSLTILLLSLTSLIVTNWCRIMLVLGGQQALNRTPLNFRQLLKNSLPFLWSVITISIWTAALMLLVAVGIFLPPIVLPLSSVFQNLIFILGAVIFLPLAFTISCINIFTTFYLIVYKRSLGKALNLGTDFFVSRWPQILGLVILLMIIYAIMFILGVALIFAARAFFGLLLLWLDRLNILLFWAIIPVLKVISSLLLWFLLAGLSVFFNQALLILFLELNTPVKDKEAEQEIVVIPAPQST